MQYCQDHHFKTCGNKEKKRKAQDEMKENDKEKRKEAEKMDRYWSALRSKHEESQEASNDFDDDDFEDPDLFVGDNDIEIVGSAGKG